MSAGGPASQPTGFPLGGNALFFNNVELRFPLLGENIQGVLFHDMGNVFSSLSNMSFRFSQKNLQDFDYTVHAAGLRRSLPDACGTHSRGSRVQPSIPRRSLGLTARRCSCCNVIRPADESAAGILHGRATKRQSLPVLLLDRTDVLMWQTR